MGPEGTIAFSEGLKVNASLTELDMRHIYIGDDGAAAIGEALKSNSVLAKLNIAGNELK